MPTSLLHPSIRKKYRLLAVLLLSPFLFYGQSLTGLWTGSLSNDSSTTRKDQSFEIALTEYKGKVFGYSRSEFIVNDTLYYIVKRVKGTIEGDLCEVVDDEIISYNFLGKLDKGIRVTSTFKRNQADSTWFLAGTWKTNSTKKYYSVTGKINLDEEKDLASSKLFPHLEELKIADEIAFYKDRKESAPIVKLARPEKIRTEYHSIAIKKDRTLPVIEADEKQRAEIKTDLVIEREAENKSQPALSTAVTPGPSGIDQVVANEIPVKSIDKPVDNLPKTDIRKTEPVVVNVNPVGSEKILAQNEIPGKNIEKPAADLPRTDSKNPGQAVVKIKPGLVNKTIAKNDDPGNKMAPAKEQPVARQHNPKPPVSKTNSTIYSAPVNTKPVQTGTVVKTENNNPTPAQIKTEAPVVKAAPEIKKPSTEVLAKAAVVGGRKSEFVQMVNFKSDSLELSLYDNGEIDGDTVSIYLDGEVILSKQGLKSTAIKKTIYISSVNEEFTLVLFAENLGKYPPNTGLLVVHDGEDIYNLRFSSDYQKNAGIVFRKKK